MRTSVKYLKEKRSIEAVYTGGVVEWSSDGKYLFSTCSNVVKVLNLDNNLETYTIGDEEDSIRITCICLDNDRRRLVVAYNNYMVREYSIPNKPEEKPQVARMWKSFHDAPILHMKFNADYSMLATGSADHSVKIWDMNNQHCTHNLKGSDVVSTLCFVRNDRMIVGYMNGKIGMFDLIKGATKKLIHEWDVHSSQVTGIIELKASRQLVTVSRDQTAALLETETKEVLKVLPLFEPIESVILAHNGNMVTVGEEGTLKEWIISSAKLLRKKTISNDRLDSLVYNPMRDELLAISANENLFVLTFKDFKLKRQVVGYHDEVYSCCLVGKENSHLAVSSNTKEIRLYNTTTWDCQLISGHSESVLSLSCADWDRTIVASSSKDNTIFVWKLIAGPDGGPTTLQPIAHATGHTNSVNTVRFSHSSRKPFMTSVSTDTTLKLWSLADIEMKPSSIEKSVKLNCSSTFVAHGKDVNCLDVSMTDALIITGGMDKLAKIWQIDSNKMQLGIAGNLTGHRRGVADAKFAPNAQKVVTCSGDMTIKIWNLQDRNCIQTLTGHNSAVFNVIFVNHGTQLISADSEGIVKIWTIASGESDNSIEAHTNKVWALTANADESEYITAGSDGRIIIWKDISDEKRAEEENKIRQKLQEEQTLNNLLDQDRYQEALEFALGLVRPYCAYKVIDQLVERGELAGSLVRLDTQKTQILLDFAVRWNTNSRTSQISQHVINTMLLIHPPEELLKLPNINSVVQSLIPYTKRHMDRLNKARQDISLLNFTWDQMRLN